MSIERKIITDGVLMHDYFTISTDEPASLVRMKQGYFNCSPDGRLEALQKFHASQKTDNEFVVLRLNALAEIIAKAEKVIQIEVTETHSNEIFLLLELGEGKMEEIIGLPRTLSGVESANGGERGRKKRDENNEPEKEAWRTKAIEILAGRKHKTSVRDLARLVAKQLHPQLSEDGIKKLADSRRKWLDGLL